ncbi:uncharacterized protein [Ptychodera flava]|uniref:uncharacterized protein n=1 Tax=Ptychodera flava TaxID=63121 RepID=UPI003969EBCC
MAIFLMVLLIVIAAIVLYRRSTAAKPKTSEINDLPNVTYELTTAGANISEQIKGITSLNNIKSHRRVKRSNHIHTYENAGLEVHGDLRKTKCLGNINISESSTDDLYHGIDESNSDLTIGSGFVLNDIYEAGDEKTVDSVMNIKRSGLGHGQNDDPKPESCLSGVMKNVTYQNVDASFEENGEEAYVVKDMHPLDENGKSDNGDKDARCTISDGQAKSRQVGAKPVGVGDISDPVSYHQTENDEYDHMYSDRGPEEEGDITEAHRFLINTFTENIAYEPNDDRSEGQARANPSVAGFVDNDIFESGEHEANPQPDSHFTENVLYQPSGDESQDLSVDDVDQDVYYSTIGDGDHQSGFQDNIAYESSNSPK